MKMVRSALRLQDSEWKTIIDGALHYAKLENSSKDVSGGDDDSMSDDDSNSDASEFENNFSDVDMIDPIPDAEATASTSTRTTWGFN